MALSYDLETVAQHVVEGKIDKDDVKLFSGYCGWGPDQLASEMQDGSWSLLHCESKDDLEATLLRDPNLNLPAISTDSKLWDSTQTSEGLLGNEKVATMDSDQSLALEELSSLDDVGEDEEEDDDIDFHAILDDGSDEANEALAESKKYEKEYDRARADSGT